MVNKYMSFIHYFFFDIKKLFISVYFRDIQTTTTFLTSLVYLLFDYSNSNIFTQATICGIHLHWYYREASTGLEAVDTCFDSVVTMYGNTND